MGLYSNIIKNFVFDCFLSLRSVLLFFGNIYFHSILFL